MAKDFQINVKADTKGIGFAAQKKRMAAMADRDEKGGGKKEEATWKKRDKVSKDSLKADQQLLNAIKANTKAIADLTRSQKAGGGRPGSSRNQPGGGGGDGGGGMGRIGAAAGLAGIPITALAYVTQKILAVGEAHIAAKMAQRGTMGLVGTQLGSGYMMAGEMGEYKKQQLLTRGGSFDTSNLKTSQTALNYRMRFGLGPGEVAKTQALMDRVNPESKEDNFKSITDRLTKNNIAAELPLVIGAISTSLEEAVSNGIQASNLSTDLAMQIGRYTQINPMHSAQAAISALKNTQQVQQDIAEGNFGGGLKSVRMFEAARGQIGANKDMLIKSGLFSKEELENPLNAEQQRIAVQAISQQNLASVDNAYNKDIATTLGGKGSYFERKRRFMVLGQTHGLFKTMQEGQMRFDSGVYDEATGQYNDKISAAQIEKDPKRKAQLMAEAAQWQRVKDSRKEGKANNLTPEDGGGTAYSVQVHRENRTLGQTGAAAAELVGKFDAMTETLINNKSVTDAATASIGALNGVMGGLVGAVGSVMAEVENFRSGTGVVMNRLENFKRKKEIISDHAQYQKETKAKYGMSMEEVNEYTRKNKRLPPTVSNDSSVVQPAPGH